MTARSQPDETCEKVSASAHRNMKSIDCQPPLPNLAERKQIDVIGAKYIEESEPITRINPNILKVFIPSLGKEISIKK